MKLFCKHFVSIFALLLILNTGLVAQSTRGLVNEGVDKYNEQKFSDAEVNFRKAMELDSSSFEAQFNLGDSFYKQQKYAEAIISFQQSLTRATTREQRAKIFYNIGNSLLKIQKISESINAYKESLKLDPNDYDAKYNLSYALSLPKNKNSSMPEPPNEVSDYAKQLKAKAEELVSRYKYKEAFNLMMEGWKIDQTVSHYQDFIQRIKNIVDIEEML